MEPEPIDGYSAWISIDNATLPQYKRTVTVAASGKKEITCWIVSEVGKEFSVHWTLPPSLERLAGQLWIDGIAMTKASKAGRPEPITVTKSYEHISETSARPLVFSGRELTDDDTYSSEVMRKNVGDIRLEIWVVAAPHKSHRYRSLQLPTKTHEQSKAMVSHQVSLGEVYHGNHTTHRCETRCISLVISFIFKYRTRDFLQAEGIIPLDPKPDPRPYQQAALAATLELSDSRDSPQVKGGTPTNSKPGMKPHKQADAAKSAKRAKPEDDHEGQFERQKQLLEIRKEELRVRKEELQLRREELELHFQFDFIKSKRQKIEAEPEPRFPVNVNPRPDMDIIDLT